MSRILGFSRWFCCANSIAEFNQMFGFRSWYENAVVYFE